MDWSNERYVRVYTRDTVTWKLLDWRARTVLLHLFRKVDRSGVLDVGSDGVLGLAAMLELPLEIVGPGIEQLTTARGGESTVTFSGAAYAIPHFLEAQEAPSSDAQRSREYRARRRDKTVAASREPSAPSRDRHESGRSVTNRVTTATPTLPRPAEPSPDETEPSEPDRTAGEISRARDPGSTDTHAADLSPRERMTIAELTYRAVSDARIMVARELGLPDQLPFPAITPATCPPAFRDLLARVREEGAGARLACARVVSNLIAQARAERSVEWLSGKAFGEGAWRHAREYVPGAKSRDRHGPRRAEPDGLRSGAYQPRPDDEHPDREISNEEAFG